MDEVVLEAARAVRPYLVKLVGIKAAATVDAQLARLLADAAGRDVEADLRGVLEAHEGTKVFVERVLEDPEHRPPDVVSAASRYAGLSGQPLLIPRPKFQCPHGDYVYYRQEKGESIPNCPTDNCPLEPVPAR